MSSHNAIGWMAKGAVLTLMALTALAWLAAYWGDSGIDPWPGTRGYR